MTKSVENWLAANAPGDVQAFVNANQLRLVGQAETIAKLKADRARLAEILGQKLKKADWDVCVDITLGLAEAREVQQLLEGR